MTPATVVLSSGHASSLQGPRETASANEAASKRDPAFEAEEERRHPGSNSGSSSRWGHRLPSSLRWALHQQSPSHGNRERESDSRDRDYGELVVRFILMKTFSGWEVRSFGFLEQVLSFDLFLHSS